MNADGPDARTGAASSSALDGTLDQGVHTFQTRIYYADTDFSGAVYHARYLEMLERGRSDYLRCLGVQHSQLERDAEPVYWVVRRMELDYLSPAHIDDVVTIETWVDHLGKARIEMGQRIVRDQKVLVQAKVTAALINGAGRPQRFPRLWAQLFDVRKAPPDAV